jgi:hypothetical protein
MKSSVADTLIFGKKLLAVMMGNWRAGADDDEHYVYAMALWSRAAFLSLDFGKYPL